MVSPNLSGFEANLTTIKESSNVVFEKMKLCINSLGQYITGIDNYRSND